MKRNSLRGCFPLRRLSPAPVPRLVLNGDARLGDVALVRGGADRALPPFTDAADFAARIITRLSGSPGADRFLGGFARGAGLIVRGAQGRSGLAQFMLGSVTLRVLPESPCDVLVVKGRGGG